MSLTSNEPIGTTARLGVSRLGATRLAATPRASQLTGTGTYAWERSDGPGGAVNDGRPPQSVVDNWTTLRS